MAEKKQPGEAERSRQARGPAGQDERKDSGEHLYRVWLKDLGVILIIIIIVVVLIVVFSVAGQCFSGIPVPP